MARGGSGIIRAGDDTGINTGQQPVAFNFDDVKQHADQYLKEIRKQAAKILADASAQADELREKVRQEGLRQARADALAELENRVRTELDRLAPTIGESIRAVATMRDDWLYTWENNALQLAFGIAEKVIGSEIASRPEISLGLIKESLEIIAGAQTAELRMNPADIELLGEQIERLVGSLRDVAEVTIVPDQSVTRGGCIAHCEQGDVDQQLQTRLERVASELCDN